MQQLQLNSSLQGGKYIIKKVLGQGGFGITYLAEQISLQRKVAIKEFFMKELCSRDESTNIITAGSAGSRDLVIKFRDKFVKEARNIAKLNHPNIVKIIDVFEENCTAYYVMEYCQNGSLSTLLKEHYPTGMPEEKALKYIKEVASALVYIHSRSINHLDVKPANIMLNEAGDAVLIDFGLAKQYDAETGSQTSTTPVGISEGYAPIEQYRKGGIGQFSPATDIYSLGATLYKLLTGVTPPDASIANEDGLPSFYASEPVKSAIIAAMQSRRVNRPQSIEAWLALLSNKPQSRKGQIDSKVTIVEGEIKQNHSNAVNKGKAFSRRTSTKKKKTAKTLLFFVVLITLLFGGLGVGMYRTWRVDNNVGDVKVSKSVTTGYEKGHEWVDLGLSVKWATCNVGARNPEDFGNYYAWGDTNSKAWYDWDNCYDCINDEKWEQDNGWDTYKINGKILIDPNSGHDTARENWGGKWRMPTDKEILELCDKCAKTWTTLNRHVGVKFTGKNGSSIFLPVAGGFYRETLFGAGGTGYYWSSSLCASKSYLATYLKILIIGGVNSEVYGNTEIIDVAVDVADNYRRNGYSVRPVME